MWFKMRKVDLGFLRRAEKTYIAECELDAPRSAVWSAFIDPTSWHHWWPGLKSASYGGAAAPYGVGTFRESTVSGQRYEEYIVVWEEGRRWGYYIDRASVPIATAQLECTEFEDHGSGTRVRWILAQDPRLLMRLTAPFFPRIMRSLLRDAMANLDRHLMTTRKRA
jgi:hypothetical protein